MKQNKKIPRALLRKLIILFAMGMGILFIGVPFGFATKDWSMFVLSPLLSLVILYKGYCLWRIIKNNAVFTLCGTCTDITPKLLHRYRRIEFINDDGVSFVLVLPKNVIFNIGYRYFCYLERPLETISDGLFDDELPTKGFIAHEILRSEL